MVHIIWPISISKITASFFSPFAYIRQKKEVRRNQSVSFGKRMQKACPPYLFQLYLLIITYFFPSHLLCHLEYFCVLVVEHRITHKHTQKQPKGARVPHKIQKITKKEDKASMIFISTWFTFRYTTGEAREQTSLEVNCAGRRW